MKRLMLIGLLACGGEDEGTGLTYYVCSCWVDCGDGDPPVDIASSGCWTATTAEVAQNAAAPSHAAFRCNHLDACECTCQTAGPCSEADTAPLHPPVYECRER